MIVTFPHFPIFYSLSQASLEQIALPGGRFVLSTPSAYFDVPASFKVMKDNFMILL